ncbi:hypothetical protein [Nocardioides sp.]|uniref:hypothetical protein n=1 Tax=Nocardioides sp. TaxID=35761 RepID=UPI00261CB02F|nr:hypothetical protein [Nocardioides sp.]
MPAASTPPIVFLDTETTSLRPDRQIWELAMVKQHPDGTSDEIAIQITNVDLSGADAQALKVGRFYDRHHLYAASRDQGAADIHVLELVDAVELVEEWTRGAIVAGVGISFDTEALGRDLRAHGLAPAWHYGIVDVKAMAAGALAGLGRPQPVPWVSDHLGAALGVTPPAADVRHTALGDARWARAIYNAITCPVPASRSIDATAGHATNQTAAVFKRLAAAGGTVQPRVAGTESDTPVKYSGPVVSDAHWDKAIRAACAQSKPHRRRLFGFCR